MRSVARPAIFWMLSLASLALAKDQQLENQAKSFVVPFDLASGFLVVITAKIGTIDGLKFIVDTGASHSGIDEALAVKLHLSRREGKINNFDKIFQVELAEVSELRLGELSLPSISVVVLNLAKYSELTTQVDGVIGLDLLGRSKSFSIDYRRKLVLFRLPADGTPHHEAFPCFVVPLSVQGVSVKLVVDTGLQGILLYRHPLRTRLPNMQVEGGITNISMGRLQLKKVSVPRVRIANLESVRTVYLLDDLQKRAIAGVDGFFGPSELHAQILEFDFDDGVLRWQE